MADKDDLGPEYRHRRRFVWSRRHSRPWALTFAVIGALILSSLAVTIAFLLKTHPGKPEANPGIETQQTR